MNIAIFDPDEISDIAHEIYDALPNRTASNNVVIKPGFGLEAYNRAVAEGAIYALRCWWLDYHYGNPFTSHLRLAQKHGMYFVQSTELAVKAYIHWVLFSEHYRALWIREACMLGALKGVPIYYYKELNEPSHANALDYLINNYHWFEDY